MSQPAAQAQAISKGFILTLSSNADVYERGERYFRDGKLLSFKTFSDQPEGGMLVRSAVEGNYKNYDVTLTLDNAGALSRYTCSCESHSIWRGACKHVVAVLFAHMEGSARLLSVEKMRQHSQSLTDTLEELIFSGIDAELAITPAHHGHEPQLRLVPVLTCGPQGFFVSFSVGHTRLYVVKNLALFVESCKREETIRYGQGLTLTHKRALFDSPSQCLLDFILAEEYLYTEVGKRIAKQFGHTRRPLSGTRELPLTQRNIDEFFMLYENREIETAGDFAEPAVFSDGVPACALSVAHLPAGTQIKAAPLAYRTLVGRKYFYIHTPGHLHRMPLTDGQVLTRLLEALATTPRREILFTADEEQRFLSIILPKLTRMGLVARVEGTPHHMQPAPLAIKVYLDAQGPDITARPVFDYGIAHNPVRDRLAEYTLRGLLLKHSFAKQESPDTFLLSGNDLIYAFLYGAGMAELAAHPHTEVLISEDLQHNIRRPQSPQLGIRLSGNLLNVTLEDAGYTLAELLEALEAYRTRKKFYRLKDGRFLNLQQDTVQAELGLLDALEPTRKDLQDESLALPAFRALYIDELTKDEGLAATHTLRRNEAFDKLVQGFSQGGHPGYKLPKSLNKILRSYQKVGFRWLKTLAHYGFGGILADDMGLGKTLQVIALLLSEQEQAATSLVVCPTSLLYNWENEIARFAPQLSTLVVSGFPEKRRELLANAAQYDVMITTYDMLKRDVALYAPMDFAFIIADEAQNIKNAGTQAAKTMKALTGRVRFALTGTPIENNLTELWSLFDFIMPGYLHGAAKFSRLYESPIVKNNDATRAAQLRQQIAPFVLRRVKKNVLRELPAKTETTLPAEMTPEQKKVYQAHLLAAKGALDHMMQHFSDNRMRILAQLTRLRQICCHPGLFLEDYEGGSGKLDLALETMQIAIESGHRVLLFSQFTGMLAQLMTALDALGGVEYFYLDGATKPRERMDMTTRFNAGERDVFLISLKAGGTGLNLTGADVVIHYDPWWNPSVMDQASDRAHRYGQEKAVQVFNIVAKDSIEEKIMALQEKKRSLIDAVITEGGSFINLLSEEEVRRLFV